MPILMKSLCIYQLFCFGLSTLLGITACAKQPKIPKPPIEIPFSLDKGAESVEVEFRITEKQTFTFGLGFYFNNKDEGSRVLKLVGTAGRNKKTGEYVDLGIPLKMKLKIQSIGKSDLPFNFEKTETRIPQYSSAANRFNKKIADIRLEPGLYKVNLENLLQAPSMQGIPIKFHIRRAYLGK